MREPERVQTVVVGGGQAGLAVGYNLAQRGLSFVILDAHDRVGDAWRNRWDSLRLFTPAWFDSLPGWSFPAQRDVFPTKDEMADYLEAYAKRFGLPVRTGVRVDGLSRHGDGFILTAGDHRFEADQVVVAMANYQGPRVPVFAGELDPGILQLHARDYKNPAQLPDGGVLIVGVGNSGADIGLDVARTHPTWLSGKESGRIPFRNESFMGRLILSRMMRFAGHHVLTVDTPLGRRLRPTLLKRAAPLIRVKPKDIAAAGIERVPRVVGVRNGRPLLADDRELDVATVIWCTGFHPGFSWINFPIFGEDGKPHHDRGVIADVPGLYFVGLHFLYAMTSATVTGVGRDAERIARAIALRAHAPAPTRERSSASGHRDSSQSSAPLIH